MSEFKEFGALERAGWSDAIRAKAYSELFASASDQATRPLLDAAGVASGLKVLDLCCGQGNVSDALLRRGCRVVGVDFSSAMLSLARARAPGASFIEADAQDLPFADGDFDAAVSNLGICHVPDPARALAQARRVLRPGGRFAMTVWCGPDVSPCFEVVYAAIKAHGSPGVTAPPGPDFHQFANREVAEGFLARAGFAGIELSQIDCAWELAQPEDFFAIFERGTVRAAMLLARQPAENLSAIRAGLTGVVRGRFAHGRHWRVPVPAALIRAVAR